VLNAQLGFGEFEKLKTWRGVRPQLLQIDSRVDSNAGSQLFDDLNMEHMDVTKFEPLTPGVLCLRSVAAFSMGLAS
jgi:hypothetical protein